MVKGAGEKERRCFHVKHFTINKNIIISMERVQRSKVKKQKPYNPNQSHHNSKGANVDTKGRRDRSYVVNVHHLVVESIQLANVKLKRDKSCFLDTPVPPI